MKLICEVESTQKLDVFIQVQIYNLKKKKKVYNTDDNIISQLF